MLIAYSPLFVSRIFLIDTANKWFSREGMPDFVPPDKVFSIAWISLYFLIGVSLFLFSTANGGIREKRAGFIFFGIQLLLNLSFIPIYFSFHSLLYNLIICSLLTIFLILNIIYFHRVSKIAAYFLIPYLLWMFFATILSYKIYILNA